MKYLKSITFIFFSLLLFAACEQEENVIKGNNMENISFKLCIPASVNTITRAGNTTASEAERTISNVYILVYETESNDANVAAPVFFHSATGLTETTGKWEKSFVRSLMNLEKDKTYKVYALANLPHDLSGGIINAPTKTTSMADLSTMLETLPTLRRQDGADISFSAYLEFTYGGNETSISLNLVRTVARLNVILTKDIDISDWTIESVTLSNENTATQYFIDNFENPVSAGTRRSAETILWNDGNKDGKANYHYYSYENKESLDGANQLSLAISLKDRKNVMHTYRAIVHSKGNSQIKRDYIYTMNITLKNSPIEPVLITCNVVQWNETNFPTNIGGEVSYLDVPEVIYFGNTGEGVLPIKTDAETVKIILDNTSRIHFLENMDINEMSFAVNSTNTCEIDLRMSDLTTELYEEIIRVEAGHLTKTVKCIRKENLLAFSVSVNDQANDKLEFPWDFDKTETGESKDLISIKIKRSVEACYFMRLFRYMPGSDLSWDLKKVEAKLPLTQANMEDEINLKLSEAPFYISENIDDSPIYLEIKVALFDTEFPYIYKTYLYTILPKSN